MSERPGPVCVFAASVVSLLAVGCDSDSPPPVARPRPVTVFELRATEPAALVQHTGSVSSWKTEDVGFEVPGRVEYIIEPGTDVAGPELNEAGDGFRAKTGTLIARLDPTRYKVQLASDQARVRTAEAELAATEQDLQEVLPKQIRATQAAVTLAQQEFERYERLHANNAATQAQVDKARADLDTSVAELDQLEATRAVKEAQRTSNQAQVAQVEEGVRQAEKDLDDTALYAPFTGQAAAVFETLGGVVREGQAVVQVQMMDPIQVEVEVSTETDQTLNYNDVVSVFPPEEGELMQALVWEKATLADPSTRTFLVTLLMRNSKLLDGMPETYDPENAVRTRNLWGLFPKTAGPEPPFYVNVDALHQDGEEFFVWKVENANRERSRQEIPSQLTVSKVRVAPGADRIPFLNVATMRELTDTGELDPSLDLVVGRLRDMDGRPLDDALGNARLEETGVVHFVRERWRFRPGDVVNVDLGGTPLKRGYYVPMSCIARDANGSSAVFVVDTFGSESVARRVPAEVDEGEHSGTQMRIEPAEGASLPEGSRIIAEGAHYVIDGEAVRVTRTVEVGP